MASRSECASRKARPLVPPDAERSPNPRGGYSRTWACCRSWRGRSHLARNGQGRQVLLWRERPAWKPCGPTSPKAARARRVPRHPVSPPRPAPFGCHGVLAVIVPCGFHVSVCWRPQCKGLATDRAETLAWFVARSGRGNPPPPSGARNAGTFAPLRVRALSVRGPAPGRRGLAAVRWPATYARAGVRQRGASRRGPPRRG